MRGRSVEILVFFCVVLVVSCTERYNSVRRLSYRKEDKKVLQALRLGRSKKVEEAQREKTGMCGLGT
ncbi:hypothetical protein A9C19_19900 [Bacillus weihaiensis]|uniref:Uncharacterized protein n=1 Tax=Bacillus weihaiensis TaxID=1547283 RepID=A0A1L3MWQ3_9BACI|nr:hypothetical protein A9C19_19900 [Bacillus weihaiensis]